MDADFNLLCKFGVNNLGLIRNEVCDLCISEICEEHLFNN